MDKLRSSYRKYQTEVFAPNPRFVSSERAKRISVQAENQIVRMRERQQFANYDQAAFYKEKFQKLSEVAEKLQLKKITQDEYDYEVKKIMETNYLSRPGLQPIPEQRPNPIMVRTVASNLKSSGKSPLKDFFDEQDMKKSKNINFSSILAKEQTPLKYGLRSVSRAKKDPSPVPKNNQELKLLQQENQRLRQQINSSKRSVNISQEQRLRQLRERVRQLDEQNKKLRTEVSKGSRTDIFVAEEYDPYNLKVRENNIMKIHTKNINWSEKMSQFQGASQHNYVVRKTPQVYYDNQSDFIKSQYTQNIGQKAVPYRRSVNFANDDILNASQSTIQTQFLNLDNDEMYDQRKNQICRQKIAFFKKSMVLAKGNDFDIAFKRSDFNYQMDKLKLILYVNNKTQKGENCVIEYDYERDDFEVMIKRKIGFVEGRTQGREEIEITCKNSRDLGSLITAKVLVGDKMKKIVVPALFIDFNPDYKYQFQNMASIERNLTSPLVINPMSQFSTIDRAINVLDMSREYEQKYEVGKLYGKSKTCKGIVKLTWKGNRKLKIQTCEEWRTLMGYLFLNAEETMDF